MHQEIRPRAAAVQQIENLSVLFSSAGRFTVIDERARGNPGALAGFGLIGLVATAVEFGSNASKDRESAQSLAAFVETAECRGGFQAAFEEKLRKAGKPTVQVVAKRPDDLRGSGFDALLEFSLGDCGFRPIDQNAPELAAFVELQARLVKADGTIAWDDRETIVSAVSNTPEQLRSEPDLARNQFDAVLRDAGRRMANNVLYP